MTVVLFALRVKKDVILPCRHHRKIVQVLQVVVLTVASRPTKQTSQVVL